MGEVAGDSAKRGALLGGPSSCPHYRRGEVRTGWGATCNMHRDRYDVGSTGCKKSINLGLAGGCNATAALRLKRWLLAGIHDHDWPKHGESTSR